MEMGLGGIQKRELENEDGKSKRCNVSSRTATKDPDQEAGLVHRRERSTGSILPDCKHVGLDCIN
jgi:hypothetical protein